MARVAVMRAPATAKLNLALVVGARRDDGLHEVATVLQRIDLVDRVAVEPAEALRVEGYPEDTLVRRALESLAAAVGTEPLWEARLWKRIPVAAGLGGGSSDAATALRLANNTLPEPLPANELRELAAGLGSDVPYFLTSGPQLGTGTGIDLEPLDLPQDYWIVVLLPHRERKESTASVYDAFDRRDGGRRFDERQAELAEVLANAERARDLAALPPNDLASSSLAAELRDLGAFRADVSGAGPAVYGLFLHRGPAAAAERELRRHGRTWLTIPTWYG
jgi:4-diphosphocytidyl-2-C-methyl-D-erythritol kinase